MVTGHFFILLIFTIMANVNTNFIPKKGVWVFEALPMKASTAMAQGAAIGIEISGNTTTGNYTLMGVENAAGADFKGILQEAITSGDADYATTGKLKLVAIPKDAEAIAEFKVSAGTFTAADVGKTVEFHSDSLGLAVDTAGKGARITKYLSSGRGECQFTLPTTETA
jgi:hypothetical protein